MIQCRGDSPIEPLRIITSSLYKYVLKDFFLLDTIALSRNQKTLRNLVSVFSE